ncbi:hypothetical protein F2Q69_00019000 [Brassica cretica]|uniref:ADP-ribosyl cyclase/cyclic ADP-ribose hydrolase n=1 Tax=Brassica cretica TaxID=69181 RepID=A0A8S9Q0A5_BRACR|nr:hypothetical protein F2Q69_00019000 [Brassica cretica]
MASSSSLSRSWLYHAFLSFRGEDAWRKALEEVAGIAGYHSSNSGNEADLINKVASDVTAVLGFTPSKDFDDFVGTEYQVTEIKSKLILQSEEIKVIALVGPAGIGKTTTARVLYNQLSPCFPFNTFLENIRGSYEKPCGNDYQLKLRLQKNLLSEIFNQKDIEVRHLGVAQQMLSGKKVLVVVLDEVDSRWQLEEMANQRGWVGPGTSTWALQIFCQYAFGQNSPDYGFTRNVHGRVDRGTTKAQGTGKVLGIFLDTSEGGEIQMSKSCFDGMNNLQFLKISPDNLCIPEGLNCLPYKLSDNEADLISKVASDVTAVLGFTPSKDFDDFVGIGAQVTKIKSKFILQSEQVKVIVLVGPAGIGKTTNARVLYNQLSPGFPFSTVLENIRGNYEKPCGNDYQSPANMPSVKSLQIMVLKCLLGKLLDLLGTGKVLGIMLDTSEGGEIQISKSAFEGMNNLQFLRVYSSDILKFSPNIPAVYSASPIPQAVGFKSLKVSKKDSRSLKSNESREIGSPWLRKFVGASATKLTICNLSNCRLLKELPSSIRCSNLKEFPNVPDSIVALVLCGTLIEEVPPSIEKLFRLRKLNMYGSKRLKTISPNISKLENLECLGLSFRDFGQLNDIGRLEATIEWGPDLKRRWRLRTDFRVDDIFPMCLPEKALTSPISLRFHGSGLMTIPDCIGRLSRLSKLVVTGCVKLVALSQLPGSLLSIEAECCLSLKRIDSPFQNPNICLNFADCSNLNPEARNLIETSACKYAFLPGQEVPAHFPHQSTSRSLTINLTQRPRPLSFRFKACILLSYLMPPSMSSSEYTFSLQFVSLDGQEGRWDNNNIEGWEEKK